LSHRVLCRRTSVCTALTALSLAACTAATLATDAPKTVTGQSLSPYELHEECVRLEAGDRVDYAFESSEPVAFHIRYRDGNAVLMPVTRENARGDAGIYGPAVAQHYCLAWEAGPAGALIDYRIRVRRAGA
jgi:hypothetical protein